VVHGNPPQADDSFQRLLLKFTEAATEGVDASALIQLFCRMSREFFQASGVYFWKVVSPHELLGTEADGHQASRFRGLRLNPRETTAAAEAIRTRRTVCVNSQGAARYRLAVEFGACSVMAAPLVVFGEVSGAVVFTHTTDPDFFHEDLAAKATILARQLGSLLEATRLTRVSAEEHRRAEILVQTAQALHDITDVSSILDALVARLRSLLNARGTVALLRKNNEFVLHGTASREEIAGNLISNCMAGDSGKVIEDLAQRAIAAGAPVTIAVDPEENGLQELSPTGVLVGIPLHTMQTAGAVIVFPENEAIEEDEKRLMAALSGLASLAIGNAELYEHANLQTRDLKRLLEISSELARISDFDKFLQQFVVRAAEFLGFSRGFVALKEGTSYRLRWSARGGKAQRRDIEFPKGVILEAISKQDVFWTDDLTKVPGANLEAAKELEIRQMLAVPLVGSDAETLGLFGVLEREDGSGIRAEDVDHARALGAQVAVALEATHHFHLSEQHRGRAEDLMSLAVELGSLLRFPDFARTFTTRAADMLEARAAALALVQGTQLEVVLLHDAHLTENHAVLRELADAISSGLAEHTNEIVTGPADKLLGGVASTLGWKHLTLARLHGVAGELTGVLCLVDRDKPLDSQDYHLLQALVSQASVALENSRLFTKMEQANRHWIEIFDAITDFIVVHDENDHVLRVNRTLADSIGVTPVELIGVSMRTLLALTNETPAGSCPFCRAGSVSDEYIDPALQRTYLVSTSRIHSPESEGLQTIHVLKDISDRREAERRYRELFDNIQEGLYFSSAEGRFIEVNDALVRMLGYENRNELLQIDIANQLYITPGHRSRFRESIQEAGVLRNYQEALRRKDGSLIHTLQNVFAVRDHEGKVIQYRGVMLDISELKNFQSQLQRERDFNTKILNNTQSMILVTDTGGAIMYANRRCNVATGYSQEQIVGRPLADLITPARRDSIESALRATVGGQLVDNLELPLMRCDGRLSQFSINLSPMRDEQGQVSSIVVVMTDITDAAMLQAKLMHTEKMAAVGHLVSGVAHEVNNPLTAILGFADLLMDNPQVPDSAKTDLRVILQEAQRTKQIVQNLLSFARQMPPQRKPVQVNSVLRRTLQLRSYDFASHGVEVEEVLSDAVPEVIGDSHQLQQVFLNILNNAYDAVRNTGRPPRITLETRVSEECVEVVFRDNGNGIKHADRIFDPFFTTKAVGEGTGLGLSICYGIVREHGGEIACYNNPDGQGATFIVRLPLANEAALLRTAGVTHEQLRNQDK